MTNIPALPLASGAIPMVGLGTWPLVGDECRRAVETGIECGYRHIDTADGYHNHKEVGAALETSGIPRDDLFITTKLGRDLLRHDDVIKTAHRCLEELGLTYIDLFLVHWPHKDIPMAGTFTAMRELVDLGLIRNFGVSNFTRSRLERAIALDLGPISVNQVEYHPYLNQKALDEFCKANGIVLTAYTPLAKGKVADDPLIRDIAEKYGKTPGQVTLRWLYQRGIVSVPKASSPEHQRGNLAIFDWELSPEDFAQIDNTGKWERIITWNVAEFED